jgi:hypothetical protein
MLIDLIVIKHDVTSCCQTICLSAVGTGRFVSMVTHSRKSLCTYKVVASYVLYEV